MSGGSTPASGGTSDDPIRIGTLLYTLVEPHRGHQVAYNRWYERDHFYAGCMIGAYNFAGGRFVSTAPLKELRYPTAGGQIEPLVPDPQIGSYLALYYVLAGHHDEWSRWAVDQVNLLHASGRMFTERDHIHTCLYRFEWEYRRDAGRRSRLSSPSTIASRASSRSSSIRPRVCRWKSSASGTAKRTCPPWRPARRWPRCSPSPPCRCSATHRATCRVRGRSSASSCCVSSTRSRPRGSTRSSPRRARRWLRPARGRWCGSLPSSRPYVGTDRYTDQLWSDGAS